MKRVSLYFLLCPCAFAHAISMSTGYATVTGNRVEYLLRMPEYEIAQVKDPQRAIFRHIRFTSGFETGRATGEECHREPAGANLICAANYEFSGPVERLGVECFFYEITVPNHIHMLHAEHAGKSDQAILDEAFPSATLGFRPPTAIEIAVEQSAAGAFRVLTNSVQLLLVLALALASRGRREASVNGAAFLFGECAAAAAILRSSWEPSPRFAEAAAALALAYLAFEMLAFPKSRGRWLLALIFGGFAGMYFAVFVTQSGYAARWVLAGAAFADSAVLSGFVLSGLALARLPLPDRHRGTLSKVASSCLLVTGAVWFYIRLRG